MTEEKPPKDQKDWSINLRRYRGRTAQNIYISVYLFRHAHMRAGTHLLLFPKDKDDSQPTSKSLSSLF